MGEPWKVHAGAMEATFGSGSHPYELSHYITSFSDAVLGFDTTGSACSGACSVYEIAGINRSGSTLYLQMFDLTGGPGPGYRPVLSLPVLSSSQISYGFRTGYSLRLGLQLGWSTGYSAFTASGGAGTLLAEFKI